MTRKFLTILEVKNYRGLFHYDSRQQQMIQEVDGKFVAYKDPILQAEAQKNHLHLWLQNHGFKDIPIETLVVVAFPSTIIKNTDENPEVYKKIIHNESLHQHLDRLSQAHSKEILTPSALQKLRKLLLTENNPLQTNILEKNQINESHLIKGVRCQQCYYWPMQRIYKTWHCPKCNTNNPNAHERHILDYFLLHSDFITNSQCREVLQIASPKVTQTILKYMNLQYTGKNSARKYFAPILSQYPQFSLIPSKSNLQK